MPGTLGSTTAKAIMPKEQYGIITDTRICTVAVEEGETVKLNSDGTISPVSAATDIPHGIVKVGNKGDADKLVTVQTPFRAIVRGQANAAITCGQRVAAVGTVTSSGGEKLTDYKTAVTTNYVVGQALTTAVDDGTVDVGLYFNPYLI